VKSKFPTNRIDPPSALAEIPSIGGKVWSRVVNANGVRVYQKADLFEATPQNLGLMRKGFAPYAKDGEPVVLHHMLQKEGEALAEVSSTMHNQLTKAIHINTGSQIPSGIDRLAFKAWKAEYWQLRAEGLEAVK
jgi:filamentous hemagglutinin